MASTCPGTLAERGDELPDLKCALPAGHDGPVHETAAGERWADQSLPEPPGPDDE